MRVGIYSGSFNPVHLGHVALADYIVHQGLVDEVWLIRSPHNPLKRSADLMPDDLRLRLLQTAIEGHTGLRVSTIEDDMPTPNYTINTLCRLRDEYPEHEFYLIIGADNWLIFDHWRNWQQILSEFHLIVYPRPGYDMPHICQSEYPTVQTVDAPLYDISSTQIRQRMLNRESLDGLVDQKVAEILLWQ